VIGPGKPLALLTYLAFSPRRTASRDYLVDLLWADSEPDRALHAMRQTVWQVRHVLGERVLMNRPGGLSLELNIVSDRDAFLAAVEAGDSERAVALYTGDFLPDFAAPGGAEFEQWADRERVRLRTAFVRSAESLTRGYLASGRVREAQRIARRTRDTDQLNEGGWRLLLETLETGHDWTAAAMEADALERLLESEEREPEPATRSAIRRARKAPDDTVAAPRNTLVAELVGREKEFAAILVAWDDAKRGTAHHLHVTAPAGLGKTRLLQDVHARLRAAGARTVHARAHAGERGIAYAFAADLAAKLAALPGAAGLSPGAASALVSLNPSLSAQYAAPAQTVRSDEALRHRSVALTELVYAVADEGPVAILLDDLHWADMESRQVLAGLAARLTGHRALLVTTARPAAERIFEGTPTALRLAPLDEQQVAALVTSIAALPDEPWARDLPARLTWATGGSPLLLLESLQLGLEREVLVLAGNSWASPDPRALVGALGAGSALRRRVEELDPAARWLILTLAAAGTPLTTRTLALAAGRPEEAVAPTLATLEERGLVSRAGSVWETVHDELAALALDGAAPDTLRDARAAVGSALAVDATREPGVARRAAPLLAAAGDERAMAALFLSWVAQSRSRGDRLPPGALAADLLGEQASSTRVHALVSTLPWYVRLGLDAPARRLALGALVTVALFAAAGARRAGNGGAPPEEVLYVVAQGGGGSPKAYLVEIRSAGWRAGEPLPFGQKVRSLPWFQRFRETAPVPAPSGNQWVGRITSNDIGGQDLYLSSGNGSVRRLTHESGDDVSPSWAPDESAIVFATARWNPLSHYDLAIQDLKTGAVRQLTSGDDSDQEPRWSPDGSRITFVRTYYDGRRRAGCSIGADASRLTCFTLPGVTAGAILGWRDDHRVVIQADSAGTLVMRILDVETGAVTRLPVPEAELVTLSPSGGWLLLQGIVPGTPRVAWWVAPLDDPSAIRQVSIAANVSAQVLWGGLARASSYLDRLRILLPGAALPVDGVHRLEAEGWDQHGQPIPSHALAWGSSDTTIATIDSGGVLRPLATGSVVVYASAGGWRSDSARITIAPPAHDVVLHERWRGSLEAEWVPYGEPLPAVVALPDGGRAFWSRGDSSFASGVYSRRAWSGRGGVGAEITATTPLTAIQWQTQVLALDAALDPSALARWDHRTGAIDLARSRLSAKCFVGFPGDEGPPAEARMHASQGLESGSIEPPADMHAGVPHRLRVQILADGRCGVAVDGRAVFISRGSVPVDRPFRVLLEGMSHRTRVLVREVEVWTGVREDVDWRGVEATTARR
jgi:DNA-binding SARP family transcriptional activator